MAMTMLAFILFGLALFLLLASAMWAAKTTSYAQRRESASSTANGIESQEE